jgi:hypothetical protein
MLTDVAICPNRGGRLETHRKESQSAGRRFVHLHSGSSARPADMSHYTNVRFSTRRPAWRLPWRRGVNQSNPVGLHSG